MTGRPLVIHRSHTAQLVRLATTTMLLIASGLAMPARAETADAVLSASAASSANPVTDWNQIAMTTLLGFPPAASGAPPALQVNLAMV
jgi:hypothetical protein